jgi:hypothetical protein
MRFGHSVGSFDCSPRIDYNGCSTNADCSDEPCARRDRRCGGFLAATEHARVKAWLYYFPLLHLYGPFRAHKLGWERCAGALLVYQIRRKQGRTRMDRICCKVGAG